MQLSKMLLSLAMFQSVLACQQTENIGSETKIIGGKPSQGRTFYAGIVNKSSKDNIFCGASFIDKRILLTAAHCVDSISNKLQVQVGFNQGNMSENKLIDITSVVVHEEWNGRSRDANDIAILKIADYDSSQYDIKPIQWNNDLNIADSSWTKPMTVIGAGELTSVGSLNEPVLREVDLTLIPSSECKKLLYNTEEGADPKNFINEKILCAGELAGAKDSCQGDSGGPLITNISGKNILAGIVSNGRGCAQKDIAGIYTRLSTYSSWIENNIKKLNAPVATVTNNVIKDAQKRSCYGPLFRTQERIGSDNNIASLTYNYEPEENAVYTRASQAMTENVISSLGNRTSACEMEIPSQEALKLDIVNMGPQNLRFVAHNSEKVWTTKATEKIYEIFISCDTGDTDTTRMIYTQGSGYMSIEGNVYVMHKLDMPSSALDEIAPSKSCRAAHLGLKYFEVQQGGETYKLVSLSGPEFGEDALFTFILGDAPGDTNKTLFAANYTKSINNTWDKLSIKYDATNGHDTHTWELSCDFNYKLKDTDGNQYSANRDTKVNDDGSILNSYKIRFNAGEKNGSFLLNTEKNFLIQTISEVSNSSQCTINGTPVSFTVN